MPRVLVLAQRAHRAMVADCLTHANTEIGGVLPGCTMGDALVVPFSIPAGPDAKCTAVRFSPDSGWQQVFLDFLFARFGVDYLGDWHRHPGLFDQPSAHDLRMARHIVTDAAWNKPEAVFPIAVIEKGQVRMRAYLMRRDNLEFEEIPIQILPDTDPRMTAVLTGMDASKKEKLHAEAKTPAVGREPRRNPARRVLRRIATGLRYISRI